jgi:hypothetical protein
MEPKKSKLQHATRREIGIAVLFGLVVGSIVAVVWVMLERAFHWQEYSSIAHGTIPAVLISLWILARPFLVKHKDETEKDK